MTMNDYVSTFQSVFGLSKEKAKEAVNTLFEQLTDKLVDNGELMLPGIGTLKIGLTAVKESYYDVHRGEVVNAKSGGNPTVKFKASTLIKKRLAGK